MANGKVIANIHNHFLKVFAAERSISQDFRKSADDAMVLSLLYSSLSGRGLGKTSGFADLFVVEDKAVNLNGLPRVRFYNITTILNDIPSDITNKIQHL